MSEYAHFLELAKTRRSIRRFTKAPVAHEDILRLLEAARWAPSNHNRQPWKFVVLEVKAQIAALADAVNRALPEKLKLLPSTASAHASELVHYATFFAAAPVLIVALHKEPASFSAVLLKGMRNPELTSGEPLSVAMAVQNLLLAARALGLGACVLTGPLIVQEVLADALILPPGHHVTCLVAVGHPAESPPPPRRKTIEQIAEFRNTPAHGNDYFP
jgi:nitroreductase